MSRRPSRAKPFESVGRARPSYSIFNLSYEKKFDFDIGQIIPVMCEECVPGDSWRIGNNSVLRFNPLVAPVLHDVSVLVDYFYVPYRILDENWEDFYTGGKDGKLELPLPRWQPTVLGSPPLGNSKGSLWDYFGFPVGVNPVGAYPIDYPRRAYNLVYNEYFRDETLTDEVLLTNEKILNCSYQKDYFTSALLWEQRGDTVAIPLVGYGSAVFKGPIFTSTSDTYNFRLVGREPSPAGGLPTLGGGFSGTPLSPLPGDTSSALNSTLFKNWMNFNTVDLANVGTFNINELRFATQLQRFLERGARGGYRYIEQLRSRFGVNPRDERLQRPEYIGGTRSKAFFSEVLQTSETNQTITPQGNMAGHGISAPVGFAGRYRVKEFGLILGLLRVRPKTGYQQGINRQWQKYVREDFYSPEFANLGEQGILVSEIYATSDSLQNNDIFGFQGRWDELRYKPDIVCGNMRDTFNYWHLSRVFNSRPYLNAEFIECKPENNKRIFAVQTATIGGVVTQIPGLIMSFGNVLSAARPLPVISEPGLLDHH